MSCINPVFRVNIYLQSCLVQTGGNGVSLDELFKDYHEYEKHCSPSNSAKEIWPIRIIPLTKREFEEIVVAKLGPATLPNSTWPNLTLLRFTESESKIRARIQQIIVPISDSAELVAFKAKL